MDHNMLAQGGSEGSIPFDPGLAPQRNAGSEPRGVGADSLAVTRPAPIILRREFDSEVLGRRVGQVADIGASQLFHALFEFDYVTARVPIKELAAIHALERLGFRFVTQTIDYRFDFSGPWPTYEPQVNTRRMTPGDAPAVRELARGGFLWDRLHTDSAIPRDRADAFYAQWAENAALARWGSGGLVATIQQKVVGFMCWEEMSPLEEPVRAPHARLGILAADPSAHVRGIGKSLVLATMRYLSHNGNDWAEAGTEAGNCPSINLYAGMGWKFFDSYVLMRWAK